MERKKIRSVVVCAMKRERRRRKPPPITATATAERERQSCRRSVAGRGRWGREWQESGGMERVEVVKKDESLVLV